MSSDSQILRTGVLFKKGSGTGPFGRRNWKPRYFVLTPSRLKYFTFEDGEQKGELSLQGCDEGVLEVMPADSMKTGSSASTIWRVAINAPERRLLVAAGTEMEMNDWVDKLVMAFRINAGQPMQRASMPAIPSRNSIMSGNSATGIRDFQNFSVPRRGVGQRHSTGADIIPSMNEQEVRMESMKKHEREEKQRLEEEYMQEKVLQQQREQEIQRQHEQEIQRQHEQELQRQDAEMRRQLAIQKEQEDAALAAVVKDEQQKRAQQNHAREMENMADERAMQETRKSQPSEDLLELQRRQKREEHARERAERKKAVQLHQEDLAIRMSLQVNDSNLIEDNESNVLSEGLSTPVVDASLAAESNKTSFQSDDDTAQLSAAIAPRSSLVGDVKREMIQKQQQKHHRRREATLQQEQQVRQQELARVKLETQVGTREVEVAPREIEVVRRAPVKTTVELPSAPMESFEF
ncbi:putative pleckstrin domain, PH-like domain superfamily [Plasmopara halstedii]